MKVFLSWSGERSKAVAHAFETWLPFVIQAIEPWVSTAIDKGTKWNTELSEALRQCSIGIVCLTADNLESQWLHFEAGALAEKQNGHVCTFLLDVSKADVVHPLGQFQHTEFNQEDTRKLVHTINAKLGEVEEKKLPNALLDQTFNKMWSELESALKKIPPVAPSIAQQKPRTPDDMLSELVETVRRIEQRLEGITRTESGILNAPLPLDSLRPSRQSDPLIGGLMGLMDADHLQRLEERLRQESLPGLLSRAVKEENRSQELRGLKKQSHSKSGASNSSGSTPNSTEDC